MSQLEIAPPQWLESKRIPDEWLEEAYETVSPGRRAALKTAIAAAYCHYEPKSGIMSATLSLPHAGFCRRLEAKPAAWAIIAFPDSYRSAARICAAALPAVTAGTSLVAAICVGARPASEVLISLELCGVEDIFCMSQNDLDRLLAHYRQHRNSGRAVLLDAARLREEASLLMESGCRFYAEWRQPSAFLMDAAFFDPELLLFAQGFLPPPLPISENTTPDAIYAVSASHAKIRTEYPDTPLVIAPGLEGFWLFPGLEPEFFRIGQTCFKLLPEGDA